MVSGNIRVSVNVGFIVSLTCASCHGCRLLGALGTNAPRKKFSGCTAHRRIWSLNSNLDLNSTESSQLEINYAFLYLLSYDE